MGCGASRTNTEVVEENGEENMNSVAWQEGHEVLQLTKKPKEIKNEDKRENENGVISPCDSVEVLNSKREKPKVKIPALVHLKAQDTTKPEPKELKQVVAWGKKTSKKEKNFLQDLRTKQNESNDEYLLYEQEYEKNKVDDKARYIDGKEVAYEEDSQSEISYHDSSNEVNNTSHQQYQEEGFDATKIIDVEKFRAANTGEKKDATTKNDDDHVDLCSSKNNGKLDKSNDDTQETNEEIKEYVNDLYNEDDKDLIESIEKEFSATEDNYLPGQIVN